MSVRWTFIQVSLRKGTSPTSPLVDDSLIATHQLGIDTPLTDELVVRVLHDMYRSAALKLAQERVNALSKDDQPKNEHYWTIQKTGEKIWEAKCSCGWIWHASDKENALMEASAHVRGVAKRQVLA